jgi:hypothetical protein
MMGVRRPFYRWGQFVVEYATVCFRSQEDFEPELPGCASTGETEEESRQNIEEAIRLYLAPAENRGNDWVSAVRLA